MLILGLLPGSNEVRTDKINHYLSPIVDELLEFWADAELQKRQIIRMAEQFEWRLFAIVVHHEVFDRAYHVSIYAKCRSTPKNVKIRTLCQPTPFKNT